MIQYCLLNKHYFKSLNFNLSVCADKQLNQNFYDLTIRLHNLLMKATNSACWHEKKKKKNCSLRKNTTVAITQVESDFNKGLLNDFAWIINTNYFNFPLVLSPRGAIQINLDLIQRVTKTTRISKVKNVLIFPILLFSAAKSIDHRTIFFNNCTRCLLASRLDDVTSKQA